LSSQRLSVTAVIASVLAVVIGASFFALLREQKQDSILMAQSGDSPEPATVHAQVAEAPAPTDRPACFKEFGSLDELMSWLKKNRAIVLAPDENGNINLVCHVPDAKDDCDDQAIRLQMKALADGFLMSLHLVEDGKILGVKVSEHTGSHMGNMAIIGNSIYYIEPEPNGNVVLITTRD
jgi:hypothetical protein